MNKPAPHRPSSSPDTSPPEKRPRIPWITISALVIALLVLALGFVWVLRGGLRPAHVAVAKKHAIAHPEKTLHEVETRSRDLLTNYALVDEVKGVYRIPIDRAIDLLCQHKSLLNPRHNTSIPIQ
ncbi:MAG: hypothetical protein KAI47_26490, partial [Deltaproteobacteria bacterium]|nr:hypothetical protein [Deltaproteobacteria bacterium]